MCSGPYLCPRCIGSGEHADDGPCRICEGKGILWGPETDERLLERVARQMMFRDIRERHQARGQTPVRGWSSPPDIPC